MAYTPTLFTKDGVTRTAYTISDDVYYRFNGWTRQGDAPPEVTLPSVKKVNGKSGPEIALAISDIPGLAAALAAGGMTEAEVTAIVSGLLTGAPAAYNTLLKIAAEMADDDSDAAALLSAIAGKADGAATTSALGTKLATTDAALRRDLPSYLVAPAALNRNWDERLGLFNVNARTMRKAKAGLARALTGGTMNIVMLGDSSLTGFNGSTTVEASSYPNQLAQHLSRLTGVKVGGTGLVPGLRNNDRWSATGTVDRVTYPGLTTLYPGATATYTSIVKGTQVDLIYSNQSNAFTVQIDGAAAINAPVSGAATMRKETIATGLSDAVHVVKIIAPVGGYVFLSHARVGYTSGIEVHNLGVGGTCADFGTSSVSWSSAAAAPTLKTSVFDPVKAAIPDPDLFIIVIGGNDIYQGDTNAHAIAGAKKMRDLYPNASCIMAQGFRLGVVPAATANDYLERKYALAQQYDFGVQDFQHVSGTYEEAYALGLVGSDLAHPATSTMAQWGQSTAEALVA